MERLHSPEFGRYVEELMSKHHVPGLAIALVQNEKIVSAGFGKASLEPPVPCTADTLFDIGSSSKSLTGASVALLVEDDEKYPEIQWDTTMSSLLPEDFVMPGEGYIKRVTVEDILSHRSGMAPHNDCILGPQSATPDTPKSVTRNLRNLPIETPIQKKYMYNNNMYTVATHLIETKTGLPFSEYLEKHFFQSLHMNSTNLQPSLAQEKRLGDRIATGYVWNPDLQTYRGFQSPDSPEAQGAGSIITSVNDYVKYVKAMLTHSSPFTSPIMTSLLLPRTIKDPSTDADTLRPLTSPSLYCVGLETRYYRGHMIASHNGLIPGFSSTHLFLPSHAFGCVIFCNAAEEGLVNTLASELIDDVLNVPRDERPDWNEIETRLADESGDLEAECEHIRQVLCPGIKKEDIKPLLKPLEAYIGPYWNVGYRGFTVEVRDEKLFVDASDRSSGFTLNFEHVWGQTGFIAVLNDGLTGDRIPMRAEFELGDGERVVKMGLHLEAELEELIWFRRVESGV